MPKGTLARPAWPGIQIGISVQIPDLPLWSQPNHFLTIKPWLPEGMNTPMGGFYTMQTKLNSIIFHITSKEPKMDWSHIEAIYCISTLFNLMQTAKYFTV